MNNYKIFINNNQFKPIILKNNTNYADLLKYQHEQFGNEQFLLTSNLMYQLIIDLIHQNNFFLKDIQFECAKSSEFKYKLINIINIKDEDLTWFYLLKKSSEENVGLNQFTLSDGNYTITVQSNGKFSANKENKNKFIKSLNKCWNEDD